MTDPTPATMRVQVDNTWHGDVEGVRVILALDTGELAEVQVAKVGGLLSVAIAGDLAPPRTTRRGVQVMVVGPTAT